MAQSALQTLNRWPCKLDLRPIPVAGDNQGMSTDDKLNEAMPVYRVTLGPAGSLRTIEIHRVGVTQVASHEDPETMARDYIANLYDVEPNSFVLDWS